MFTYLSTLLATELDISPDAKQVIVQSITLSESDRRKLRLVTFGTLSTFKYDVVVVVLDILSLSQGSTMATIAEDYLNDESANGFRLGMYFEAYSHNYLS